ncbi:interleukin-1 receptor type 2-like isoform X2 [Thunnus maccoyii]|uniref:interleukin-1 receptor type 2-like isoform X2 n=1 Tax=Thunnus maccoyii TaxID=8240 RepID=UPI001C4AA272|nr:interleukin-1 receptor type 2-like isoform X2 [Thunnus maccoyii]
MIPVVKPSHAGFYTCQSAHQQPAVQSPDPAQTTTTTVPDISMTSEPGLSSSSSSSSTVHTPTLKPPVIVSPLNGTIFESPHGSGLELFCMVLTGCQAADSTVVTWLVNGQSVESSYLDGRALQGARRHTRVSEGCQIELRLIVVAMTEEDIQTELKCVTQNEGGRQEVVTQLQLEDSTFTWVVVATVAVSCFLTVVSVFLYVLLKPKRKKKMDYFLARQNSTF